MSLTDFIVGGKIKLNEDWEYAREEFPDYLTFISEPVEMDLDAELAKPLDYDSQTSLTQRHWDVYAQPRLKSKLLPEAEALIPKISKQCKDCFKQIIRYEGDKSFSVHQIYINNMP